MWYCRLCDVSFTSESVEQHVFGNHMKPSKIGSIKVYNCGECRFTAEGFEDIALHCINLGHQPKSVSRKLANYKEYAAHLFTALEAMMCSEESMAPEVAENSPMSPKKGSDENNIDWCEESAVLKDLFLDTAILKTEDENFDFFGNIITPEASKRRRQDLLESSNRVSSESMSKPTTTATPEPALVKTLKLLQNEKSSPAKLPLDSSATPDSISTGTVIDSDEIAEASAPKKQEMTYIQPPSTSNPVPVRSPDGPSTKTYPCAYCPQLSTSPANATVHERIHTGEKPYRCSQCPMGFSNSGTLKRHQRSTVHAGEKRCACPYCAKEFSRQEHLRLHLKKHTEEKPYFCATCLVGFGQWADFIAHQREKHTPKKKDAKAYQCQFCGKEFAESRNLSVHERIHTGEKPYSCSTCGKSFNQQDTLQYHQRVHSGEKPFPCPTCGKTFRNKSHLADHRRRTHLRRLNPTPAHVY